MWTFFAAKKHGYVVTVFFLPSPVKINPGWERREESPRNQRQDRSTGLKYRALFAQLLVECRPHINDPYLQIFLSVPFVFVELEHYIDRLFVLK